MKKKLGNNGCFQCRKIHGITLKCFREERKHFLYSFIYNY